MVTLEDVLSPVLKHARLDGITLGNIACVSKTCLTHIDWDVIKKTYVCENTSDKPYPIVDLKTDFVSKKMKINETYDYSLAEREIFNEYGLIRETNALYQYKLVPADIASMTRYTVLVTAKVLDTKPFLYRYVSNISVGVKICDVVSVALMRHGGPRNL